ncbi:MAG TPA: glycosyltransferase family 2 protein, partial [Pirellulaceae bacterium]
MNSGPGISVIVPTRNAASFIDACLDSLRVQTYREFEVLVIDGASSDDTVEKAVSRSAGFGGSLHCVSEPDSGVYEAMNKGISLARYPWLYFLGADDTLHDPAVLSDVAEIIAAPGADIVYGDVVELGSRKRYAGEFDLDRLLFDCNLCHQSVFYNRSLFDRLGGYSKRYPIWADWEFNIRCFRHPGVRARWINRLIANYRER